MALTSKILVSSAIKSRRVVLQNNFRRNLHLSKNFPSSSSFNNKPIISKVSSDSNSYHRQYWATPQYLTSSNNNNIEDKTSNPHPSPPEPFMRLAIETPEDMEDVGSVLSMQSQKGDVIFLDGDLGAGKTCFSRGFIRAKTGLFDMKVTSPTYLLSNVYDGIDSILVHHMDLYRLSGSVQDFEPLNLSHVFTECISLIEWPTRLGALTPDVRLEIYINIDDETGERTLTLIPHGEIWKERLLFLREEGYLDDLMMED